MVVALLEFAIALMTILDQINKESFQRFKLRMGNHFYNYINNILTVTMQV